MALEGIVGKLWKQTDKITESRYDYISIKDKTLAASNTIMSNYKRGAAEGPAIVDKVEEFSALYLSSAGRNFGDVTDKGAKEQYANEMRQILGKNYFTFRDAIRTDDIETALSLAKKAFVDNNYTAEVESVVERIQLLAPDKQMEWAKHAVEQIGGNNPLAVLQNLGGYVNTLREIKALRQPYIATPSPKA